MDIGKNIFWVTISLVIIVICTAQGYFIYKNEIDRKIRREKLDSYYFQELRTDYALYLDKNTPNEDKRIWFQEIEDLKKQMASDNYGKAEIEEIRAKARQAGQEDNFNWYKWLKEDSTGNNQIV